MSPLFMAVAAGFVLGLRHAADADHLVAMSTLVSRSGRFGASWLLGAFWGLGHTLTIFLAGFLIIGLKLAVPPLVGAGLEFSVGAMLCVLGAMNLAGFGLGTLGIREHSHEHRHGESHLHHPDEGGGAGPHEHLHAHSRPLEGLVRAAGKARLWRSFGVGMVHGLAGSSAVALMALAAIPGLRAGLAYLLVFGAGTLLGMMGLSTLMEGTFLLAVRRLDLQRRIVSGAGWMSLGFGLYIMYAIGLAGRAPH